MDANQRELLFPHFASLRCKTKPQTGVWDSKEGCWRVDGHQENDAGPCQIYDMNETNGWRKMKMVGVWSLAGSAKTGANCYEWETAAELMKKRKEKKELTFFIRHPRIINRVQAFWWGWRKPLDTWLTSYRRGGRWGEHRSKKKREFCWGTKLKFLALKRGQVKPKEE